MAYMLGLTKSCLALYLAYFLTFLVGHPAWQRPIPPESVADSAYGRPKVSLPAASLSDKAAAALGAGLPSLRPSQNDPSKASSTDRSAEEAAEVGAESERYPETEAPPLRFEWKSGSIERAWMLHRALQEFEDPLLESDTRPEILLRSMNRQLSIHSMIMLAALVWCSLLAVALLSSPHYWFYRPMSLILTSLSLLILALQILILQRQEAQAWEESYLQTHMIIEISLAILGLASVGALLYYRSRRQRPFLDHLKRPAKGRVNRLKLLYLYSRDLLVIVAVGMLLANLLLLPIYQLQERQPLLFVLLLIIGLALLFFYYTGSYIRTARLYGQKSAPYAALGFISFRLLQNTLLILLFCGGVALLLGAIFGLMLENIHLLESAKIFVKSQSL